MSAIAASYRKVENFIHSESVQTLRRGEHLIAGALMTGALGCIALTSWFTPGCTNGMAFTVTALSAGIAKFYGGAEGAAKVFFDYFPKACELARTVLVSDPQVNSNGIWLGNGKDVRWWQFFDERLAKGLGNFLHGEGVGTAWDFGCGQDHYSKALGSYGVKCRGLDGNSFLVPLEDVQDLSQKFNREKRDCVISFGVGAEIPQEYEANFIDNVACHAKKLVVLSWSVSRQKGPRQFNPQTNDSIIEKMKARGWEFDGAASEKLRGKSHPICCWFQDTLMVFRKTD